MGAFHCRSQAEDFEALIDQGVDLDRPVLPGTLTRMQKHVFDDRIGALAVLHDLVEVALQHIRNSGDLCAELAVEVRTAERFPQFINAQPRPLRNC
jgi:hypothetical protein